MQNNSRSSATTGWFMWGYTHSFDYWHAGKGEEDHNGLNLSNWYSLGLPDDVISMREMQGC